MTEEHFPISIGLMMVSFIWAVFAFDNILDTAGKKFDIGSFVISIFAFGGITLGIGNIGTYGWRSVQVLPVLVVGCVAAALFVYRQLHYKETFCNCVFDGGSSWWNQNLINRKKRRPITLRQVWFLRFF